MNLLLFAGAKIAWSLTCSCSNVAPLSHLVKVLWNGFLLGSHSPITSTFHFGILMSTICSVTNASILLTEKRIEHARTFELNFSFCCEPLVMRDYIWNTISFFNFLACGGLLLRKLTSIALTSRYQVTLAQELLILLIRLVSERGFCGLTEKEALRRELVQRLAVGDATHSFLLKALPPRLQDSKHLQECLDAVAVYCNPSGMQQVNVFL